MVFEAEYSEFEQAILWKKEVVQEQHEIVDEQTQPQFVIEDDEEGEEEGEHPRSQNAQNAQPEVKTKTLPSLAERLVSCAVDLLFCCGFTLPTSIQVDHYKINYVIWYVIYLDGDGYPGPNFRIGRRELDRRLTQEQITHMTTTKWRFFVSS